MGFFKDFKRDFAQAVNELMPDKDELGAEYDDEDMVNTFVKMTDGGCTGRSVGESG